MAANDGPPMDPNTSEATAAQLDFARAQGKTYGDALNYMTGTVADDGGEQRAGDYLIGYAIEQPLLWHPMIYHYGRNWTVPADGEYTLRVRVEPPTFMRHDETNGRQFLEPVETEFRSVKVKRGRG